MSLAERLRERRLPVLRSPVGGLRLRGWLDPAVLALALMALASGFGQFGAVSALGSVAKTFGRVTHGASLADQAGLSTTVLGIGLAILRVASLGGFPIAGLADRFGRRRVLLLTCTFGLGFTVAAAASPGYWWFVAIFAMGRPLLSATNAVAQVGAAEETSSSDRAKAIALIAAGYGIGGGLTAVIHGLAGAIGFRGVFTLAVVPLVGVLLVKRWLVEPDRFAVAAAAQTHPTPVLGAVSRPFRWRLLVVCALALAVSVVTGPANSFVYIYAQNILKLSGAVVAAMVVVAGIFGLIGLLLGRWLADHWGRRPTGAVAMASMAVTGTLAYTGSHVALFIFYELGILSASTFAPAAGALLNELFPTGVRASVAGWNIAASVVGAVIGLIAFGSVADVGNHYAIGAAATFLPVLLAISLFLLLPETKGKEPEDLWPDTS
jgi:MFS family permease